MADNHLTEELSEEKMAVNDGKRVCALCDEKFKTMKELKKHYEEYHEELELKYEEHVFNTDESFEKWKKGRRIKNKVVIREKCWYQERCEEQAIYLLYL
ncbi:hypothetical protein TNCT_671831 [Trichonephila clavata]|uniref:C2H2-type domain-containing protein n=1 Tax=Trichonephila clavata TaxID=2740835 RepID=A0A8X6IRB2_TRICU|nr:hypothetical protein TNCT_671831 [Trichonephila clavata]